MGQRGGGGVAEQGRGGGGHDQILSLPNSQRSVGGGGTRKWDLLGRLEASYISDTGDKV